jgi:predicted 3-demethylubiquinone-9 3-methyltransferase (glyoxalase superfamily)
MSERKRKTSRSMNKVTPFLMFNDQLEAAIEFYTATFPDSEVRNVTRGGKGGPVISAEFVVGGQRFVGYNGGKHFRFTDGFSLFVDCEDQREVDKYWGKLVRAGAKPSRCGWITDPFGLSWQIIPRRFMELMGDPNPRKAQAVVGAMMKMSKLDVAALEKAHAAA